ncbi:MAG: hypothetical protein HDS66_07775 [Bacteroidales bacterium]|nr:hypothetical protein [Bacteroidales bacterium]
MKKIIFGLALGLVAAGMLSACSSNKNNEDSAQVVEEAVGEVVEMPAEGSGDTGVIAEGEAIAVQETAAAQAN